MSGLKATIFSIFNLIEDSDNQWLRNSFIILVPLYVASFLTSAVLSIHKAIEAKNKNYNIVLTSTLALLYAAIAVFCSIALFNAGNIYMFVMAGALCFMGSSLACFAAFSGLIHNLYQAYHAPKGSIDSKHYQQQAYKQLFQTILGLGTALALYVLTTPLSNTSGLMYVIGYATTISISSAQSIWYLIGEETRSNIKNLFGTNKPIRDMPPVHSDNQNAITTINDKQSIEHLATQSPPLLHRAYRKTIIRSQLNKGHIEQAQQYLIRAIEHKIKQYPVQSNNQKTNAKITALQAAREALEQNQSPNSLELVNQIIERPSLAHQSFFTRISDTIDIIEAVQYFLIHTQNMPFTSLEDDQSSAIPYAISQA